MIDPGGAFGRLLSELSAEEQYGPVKDLTELDLRRRGREELERLLAAIEREVRILRQRFQRLPALPDIACVRWAQSVLACPNGRILVVDTAAEEGGIVRVLLLDYAGACAFDRIIAPGRLLEEQTLRDLGLTARDLREAPSLPHAWPSLLEALMGHYIVAFNLGRIRRALERAAEQYGLDPLPIIGDCLLRQCQRYFQASGLVELSSLCALVGHPLPAPPDRTAAERARGQLHLLQSMARGITGAPGNAARREVPDDKCVDEEIF